ncbi:hypothetical protein GGF46_003299 [Coemansia sp. RSA 552]|nr:hypothetical protein GGF46_003299 [Coemansia sp. RSA 552]
MLSALYRRVLWRHLPALVAGVLAGYFAGRNRHLVLQQLSPTALLNTATEVSGFQQDVVKGVVASERREKAALVALVRNSDLYGLRQAMRQVEDRFNRNYNYPYIFVNDVPFTEEFKRGVRAVTAAPVEFGTLDAKSWGIPTWIDQQRYAEVKRTARYPHGKEDSYRKMCRFQSGYLHRHPLLQDLDYYWRIEPDVEYYCDINYDPFRYMQDNGFKYGWNIAMAEFMETIPSLWNTTLQFAREHPEAIAKDSMWQWLVNDSGTYNGCHFWSNFEIVDLRFYRSREYQLFFDYLDRAGGFFYERWGDAPVHSIAASLFLNASQVHYFEDTGYYHPHVVSCPRGASTQGRCICDESKSFIQDGLCTVRYKQVRQMILDPNATEPVHTGVVHRDVPAVQVVTSFG